MIDRIETVREADRGMLGRGLKLALRLWLCCLTVCFLQGQPNQEPSSQEVPQQVEVDPVAEDEAIARRLSRILEATGWFRGTQVRVDEGVAFLSGNTDQETHRQWAGQLARNTQGVVAVVNRIEVTESSIWDLSPAWYRLQQLAADAVSASPLVLLALVILIVTLLATSWSVRVAGSLLGRRLRSKLLRDVAARVAAIPVFLLGLYLVLQASGLTGLAATVVGGTGLLGLIIGFAFRDIAENFLASVLISMQRPFSTNDLVEVAGYKGYVQSVNTRSTLLMTLEGNHVQIPNAAVYKDTITNFTANPNARLDFSVGIGYEDSISEAQQVAARVLGEHPSVVDDPEPLVLVEALGAATVNLRVYFWVDISRYSGIKVRSAVIRMTKSAFEQAGISMPDEAREVVFPHGVPVQMTSSEKPRTPPSIEPQRPSADETFAAPSEGDLTSEAPEIEEQARNSRSPEGGANLLEPQK